MSMKKEINLTTGDIKKVLLIFMIPIFFANLFQQLYNTVDTMIVGKYLGDNALAAMGSSASLYELLVGFATGVGSGFGVVIAKYVGAKDTKSMKKSIVGALLLSVILTISIMLISTYALKSLLNILNTPELVFNDAYSYIYTICIASGVTVFYNLLGCMLRAKGNTIIPLVGLLISSVLNIFLDIYCITSLNMGTRGAAIATVISQGISVIFCLVYILIKERDMLPSLDSFQFDKNLYLDLIGQGLSMGLMLSIVSLGTVILQTSINSCGTEVIAGYTAARKIFNFETMALATLSTALTTFVSQNLGANNLDRIKQGVKHGNKLGYIWCVISIVIIVPTSAFFIRLISSTANNNILYYGSTYLRISTILMPVLSPLLNYRCALQGLGKKIVPLISSIIELVGKYILVKLLIPVAGFMGICFTEPIVWIFMLIELVYAYRTSFLFKKDREKV